jgi:hypothetical protein
LVAVAKIAKTFGAKGFRSAKRLDGASAILSMEIQLVLGGISSSNPSSMKVSR